MSDICRYGGYNEQMINRFVWMGFDLDRVVLASRRASLRSYKPNTKGALDL